jgi:oxygen-independent coproporphyrinogen-3 oxidase
VCANPDHETWRWAIMKELDCESLLLGNRRLSSIYFGGGTPSLIPANCVSNIIDSAVGYWPSPDGIEITLEANPTTADRDKLRKYLSAGVNRLSIGIQSFNDELLHFLGRKHTAAQANNAFYTAQKAGFKNISIDMIFAIPGQTGSMLLDDLEMAINLNPQHISAYQLSIEKGAKLYTDYAFGHFDMPKENNIIWQFDEICRKLTSAGYKHYEVSNFAKVGYESRHNLTYWQYQEYLGLGPGAHSRIARSNEIFAAERTSNIQQWLNDPIGGGRTSKLSKENVLSEILIMGLRTAQGAMMSTLMDKVGPQETVNFLESPKIKELIKLGMLKKSSESMLIPEQHLLKTDAIIREILK